MRYSLPLFITLFLATAITSGNSSDLTCKGTSSDSDRACDWFCKLLDQAEGRCSEARDCGCSGTLGSDVDLFKVESREDELSGLPSFLQNIIFLPLSRSYFFRERKNLLTPRFYELANTENFYLPTSDGGVLGAWHIGTGAIESLTQEDKLIVYMHGNSLDRGFSYRISLYNKLTELGFHVLAFDYRSYGDSSPVRLSETTTLEDGLAVFKWLKSLYPESSLAPHILLWGHSLGTAIATRTLATLEAESEAGARVRGLVLEAPFNKMEDEVKSFSAAQWTSWLLGVDIADSIKTADTEFKTEEYIKNISVPILIMHAEDDRIVPSHLSEVLADTALTAGRDVELHLFPRDLRLSHRYIYRAPGIEEIINNFEKKTRTKLL